ncbi:MAG: hypothetical protein P1S60_07345, partial [Anaerolineae bacterium]|nr:hypothetical protein [Anaerolineae bacterium]
MTLKKYIDAPRSLFPSVLLILVLITAVMRISWVLAPGVNAMPVTAGGQHTPALGGYFIYDQRSDSFTTIGNLEHVQMSVDGLRLQLASGTPWLRFLGHNPDVALTGEAALASRANIFKGSDPAQWQRSLPLYRSVLYTALYPGIDLAYTVHDGKLKSDFIIHPGANVDDIRLYYPGCASMTFQDGMLHVHFPSGEVLKEQI